MKIKKAVITAAGYGTRFFPLTKTIQKEMVPILNRPLIDYVVEDLLKAGIEEIIFVVKDTDTQIQHFYTEASEVKAYLARMGKMDKYPDLARLHEKAKFTFVTQKPTDPYGTATPLRLVRENVENEEAFFMFMGDDFIYNPDGSSEASKMLDLFTKSNARSLATFIRRPKELLYKYGVARTRKTNDFEFLIDIYEKPEPGKEPSNLVNISKYIFTPDVYNALDQQEINPIHNEWLITDTISILAKQSDVVIYPTSGEYLDGGYVEGWLKANLLVASQDKELAKSLYDYSQAILKKD